jgi:pimeloyl-ACP methyl ester carboxylesterase
MCQLFSSNRAINIDGVEGTWLGSLAVQNMEIRVVFHISLSDKGMYQGTMDSPDQGARGLRLDKVSFKDNIFIVELNKAMIKYEATLSEDGNSLEGTITQGGYRSSLKMIRVDEVIRKVRPQDPIKPFPYIEEDVMYTNAQAGVKLAGTLTLPKQGVPAPAVILISGSGAQDRNEEVMGHRPFLVLADHLTRKGIAVLRVDDRGMGGSTGEVEDATSAELAHDVLSGINFLSKRTDIDKQKIGLIGHSEGGFIASIVASKTKEVAFLISLAGPSIPGDEIMYLQSRLIALANGASEKEISRNLATQKKIYEIVKSNESVAAMKKRLRQLFLADLDNLAEESQKTIEELEASFDVQVKLVTSKWFRFFISYDPSEHFCFVRCPVLAIYGEKDLQVPPKENSFALKEALRKAENTDVTIMEIPGLNHMFQKARIGIPSEYAEISETINSDVLDIISEWILKRVICP